MAWENVIVGYEIKVFEKGETIPSGAKFIRHYDVFIRMAGWVSNPYPYYEPRYEYQVPIYKKKNIKRK